MLRNAAANRGGRGGRNASGLYALPAPARRVAAYDALGSFALAPIGTTLAGPIALAIGTTATLLGAGATVIASAAVVLSVREVRTLTRRTTPAPCISQSFH